MISALEAAEISRRRTEKDGYAVELLRRIDDQINRCCAYGYTHTVIDISKYDENQVLASNEVKKFMEDKGYAITETVEAPSDTWRSRNRYTWQIQW